MAAFSAEQQMLRFQAQRDNSGEPYPLSVPVSWVTSSDKKGEVLHAAALVVGQTDRSPSFSPRDTEASAAGQAHRSPSFNPWDALSVYSERGDDKTFLAAGIGSAGEATSIAGAEGGCETEAGAPAAETSGSSRVEAAEAPALVASRAFEQAHVRMDADLASFMLPWETPLMRTIFSDDDPTVLASLTPGIFRVPGSVPPVPGPPAAKPGKKPSNPLLNQESLAAHAIRPLRDEDDSSKEDRLLRQAVSKWALVLGRYCKEFNLVHCEEEEILACFGARSVHTVSKRANGFLSYLRWFDVLSGCQGSVFSDAVYWKYLAFLDASAAAASSASSFLSCLRFAKHVMGMGNIEDPSRRCVGRAEKILSRAGVVRQAAPLSVAQICKIHDLLHAEGTSRWDKALCAYVLLCLYGRARHSDFRNIERVEWDVTPLSEGFAEEGREGYIVVYTRNHKTSRATAKKLKLLPIIIPVSGIHGRPWAFAARTAFERVGLVLDGAVSGPLFKPPKSFEEIGLCNRSITSGEVSVFLRLLLDLPADPLEEGPKVSSHSLKRTCLSWSSKAGHDRLTRCCLGRHSYATEGTEAIYSVELGLPHVQKLEVLMTFIRQGTFAPDAARARMWAFPPPTAGVVQPAPQVLPDPKPPLPAESDVGPAGNADAPSSSGGEGQSSSSTSDSSSSSDSESSDPPGKRMRSSREQEAVVATGGWVVHRRSQILHRVYHDKVLVCGRPRTDHYRVVTDITRVGNLMCKTCERNSSS